MGAHALFCANKASLDAKLFLSDNLLSVVVENASIILLHYGVGAEAHR